MNKKILNILVLMISITLFLVVTNVSAFTKSIDSEISSDKTEIKQGEKVTIYLNLPNKDKINAYKADISYDETVWELVSENSFSLQDNWEYLKYNKNNYSFILINKEEIENPEMLKIELLAKKTAPEGQTTISISNISASDVKYEYKGTVIQTVIKINENEEYKEDDNQDDNDDDKQDEDDDDNQNDDNQDDNNQNDDDNKVDDGNQNNDPNNNQDDDQEKDPSHEEKPSTDKTTSDTQYDKPVTNIISNNNSNNQNTKEDTSTTNNQNNSTIENQDDVIKDDQTIPNASSKQETSKENTAETDSSKGNLALIIIIVVIIVLALIILCFCKKRLDKILIVITIFSLVFSSLPIISAQSIYFLGDISNNSLIDDDDIELLEEHLIALKILKNKDKVDMNSDNIINLIDLALLINQQLENPYDTYNITNITKWEPLPIVSDELLQQEEVTTGGEGCQWPIGMAISKDGQLLLIGTDVGGVYRSTDGGKTYEQSNSGLSSRGVGAFAIDPHNSSYVIAVGINSYAYDSNGLYISEDSGRTWQGTKTMLIKGHRDVRDSVSYDESSYNQDRNRTMIAYWSTAYDLEDNDLTENNKGLYQTTDGGYTWNLINSELSDGTVKVNPNTGEVYVSKSNGIYYSSDKGVNFTKIVDDTITGFDLISFENKISLYYCNNTGLYISKDGLSFNKIESTSYPAKTPMNIKVSPVDKNKMIIISKEGEYRNFPYYSLDGGHTWEKSILDNSLSMMPYNNRSSIPLWSLTTNKVWLFVQGDFVSSSIDSGRTFKWDSNGITGILSGGYVHHNVYNPDIIYFGSQDYNGAITTDGGKTWEYVNMSENQWGGFCYGGYAVDENTYFVGVADSWYSPRRLKITFDGGKTIIDTGLYFTQENLRNSIESSYQSPTDPKVLFAADLRSDDGGHTWKKMEGCINVYTHNPKGQKELYGMDETAEHVVVSYDNGETWEKVNKEKFQPNPNFPPLKVDDVAYDWKHDSVYVAAGWGYLYRVSLKDGHQEYVLNKYLKKYQTAPLNQKGNYVITRVAVDPNDPNIIYCGGAGNAYMNDSALYRSVDGGKSFQVITSNTTNSIVKTGPQGGFETNSIEVNPKTGELLFAGGCFGISKLSPPYKNPQDLEN